MKKNLNYDHRVIEPKWQKKWDKAGLHRAQDFAGKPEKYILFEFPYPSGERLHVGHARSYTALDAMARKYRRQGFNVLLPLGWDAFGLPAENYAVKTGINPNVTTQQNIANAKRQAQSWGLSVDWEREISTTDPNYYKWTQWIFLQLYQKGLAYRAEVPVNWCPFCKTNLADEEVLADGSHERCGNQTEKRRQKQWLFKITAYAERLLQDLSEVDYSAKIARQQINWIGKTTGITIDYPLIGSDKVISCYSTRPETNFGATFVVVAPEHPFLADLGRPPRNLTPKILQELKEYQEKAKRKSELERTDLAKEKTGVFTGLFCLNRLTGEKIPIWVSDFVVLSAGTGMVVGVPAHDERDWQFARKYGLKITPVVKPKKEDWDFGKAPFLEIDEALVFNSDFLNGLPVSEARKKIIKYLVGKGWGKEAVNYHLRDWVFSRQHYWGEPIPIIYCQKCGVVPVAEKDLPVELPYVEKFQPTATGESPLADIKEWVNTRCSQCQGPAKRETDTMPNWAGSNWYFIRYLDPRNEKELVSMAKAKYWLPVDLYNGGMEHTTLHLLYSRFIYKFLFDLGVVPTKEPYACRRSHGMVLGPDGQKMSKSRGNVINPDQVVISYGADAFRLYESFMGPFDQVISWSQEGLEGCSRFLKRVWQLVIKKGKDGTKEKELERKLHQTIKKVGEDLEKMKFNTAVAAMMKFVNYWQKDRTGLSEENKGKFLQILAPFAPHITEELWEILGRDFSIHTSQWPEFADNLIEEEKITFVIQVNGKVRDKISVGTQSAKDRPTAEKLAQKSGKIRSYLTGKKIKNVFFVPGKLINFVVS